MNLGKKQKHILSVMTGAVLLLGAALVVIWLGLHSSSSQKTEESSEATEMKTVTVLPETITQLAKMTVQNEQGSYTIVPDGEDYRVEELDDLPQDKTLVRYLAESTFEMTIESEIGEVEDLSEYGLKDPAITITLTFADGSAKQLLVGNLVPFDGEKRYFCAPGSQCVYIVKTDEHLAEGIEAFVSTRVIQNTAGDGSDVFTSFTLSGSDFPEKLVVRNQNGTYYLEEPVFASVNKEQLAYAAVQLGGLTARQAIAVHPGAELLSELGFDTPRAELRATLNGTPYRIRVAAKDSATDYVLVDGMDVVFEVLRSNISAWADLSRLTLQDRTVVSVGVADIAELTYQSGDASFSLTVERTEDDSRSTEDKTYYTYEAQSGGTVLDASAYEAFVQAVGALTIVEHRQIEAVDADFTIIWKTFSGDEHRLSFLPAGEGRSLAVLDGGRMGLVADSSADAIRTKAEALFAR